MGKILHRQPLYGYLVNGRPTAFFQEKRGIRQGCPMSPFLYILIAYALSRRLNRLKNEEILPSISFMRGVQAINHAQFADDTILLGSASTQIAIRFKNSLDLFLKVSGSKLTPINLGFMDGTAHQQSVAKLPRLWKSR